LNAGKVILVLGGVRSGKSRFGQELATMLGGNDVLFVATAEARDEEMSRRIDLHRASRPATWQTLEQPLNVGTALATTDQFRPVILLDCLTLLVSNVILQDHTDVDAAEQRMRLEVDSLVEIVRQRDATLIVVSGEVGLGVVPESSLGRLFRDMLGWANQSLASHATATYFMMAGLPINATKLATTVSEAAALIADARAEGVN
jgi:adenosylcobinamide kinase / adenosylcobinamide-phosphate guanylyltransferase